jgi:flagellar biosynthetic protein FliO
MINKITVKFGTFLIILLTAFGAEAMVDLKGLNFLEDVVTETTETESFYNIEFTKPIKYFTGPTFFKKSIQLDFPNAYIDPSKQTFPIDSSIVSEVFVAQIDPKTVRVRFVLTNENIDLREQFQIQKAGRFLNINIGAPVSANPQNYAMTEEVSNSFPEKKIIRETPKVVTPPKTYKTSKVNKTASVYKKPKVNKVSKTYKVSKTNNTASVFETSKAPQASKPDEDVLDDILREIDQAKKTLAASDSYTYDEPATTEPAVQRQTEKQPREPNAEIEQVADISYRDQLQSIISRKDPLPETSKPKRRESIQQTDPSNKPLKFLDYDGDLTNGSAPGMPETAGKMFSSLALVLGVMFLIFYVFKKFVLKNGLMGGNTQTIKVIGTGVLGPRKSVSLVEVAGEILVLGISNDNISLLSKIEDEEKIEELKTAPSATISSAWKNVKKEKPNKEKPSSVASIPTKKPAKKVDNQAFANYVRQFSKEKSDPKPSISKAASSIQKNLGKLRTA